MEKLEHIGIAVRSIDKANAIFSQLLGTEHYKIEVIESEGVRTSFFKLGGVKLEFLEATSEDSPIAKFIEKRGEGVHHLAFQVPDLAQSMADCQKKGFQLINETPKQGADNKMICFLHPKTTAGILVELCADIEAISSSSH